MSDPEIPHQPLLAAPDRADNNVQGGRSSRAYKVAGITLLACVLIVSQVMIAYFLLSQRGDIRSLKEQNDNLRSDMTQGRSVAVPVRMPMPMNTLPKLMDVSMDEEASTGGPAKTRQITVCELEEAGAKAGPAGFRPACDELGRYKTMQCFMGQCWCVDTNGKPIPGTMKTGHVQCSAVSTGGLSKMLTVPNADDIIIN